MRYSDIITERASGVLYHFTTIRNATDILFQNRLNFSRNQSDYVINKKYPYYASMARSKLTDAYGLITNDISGENKLRGQHANACLVFDGEWFNRHPDVISKPIEIDNFYSSKEGKKVFQMNARKHQQSMMEDRIWCNKSILVLRQNAIKEFHFGNYRLIGLNKQELDEETLKKAIDVAFHRSIPWWMYDDVSTFRFQNKNKAIASHIGKGPLGNEIN